MIQDTPEDFELDFCTRVQPLLVSAVFRRVTDELHRQGWLVEALGTEQSGYRVNGHPDKPSIRWRLLDNGALQVVARPGAVTWVPVRMIDAAFAERLVSEWWAKVVS